MRDPARRWLFGMTVLIALLVVQCVGGQTPSTQPRDVEKDEQWFAVELGGARMGFAHQVVAASGDEVLNTMTMKMTVGRGSSAVAVSMITTSRESSDGELYEMTLRQDMSGQAQHWRWTFAEDHVEQHVREGGRERTSRLDLPAGAWLGPGAAETYFAERRRAGAKDITYRTIEADGGLQAVKYRHVYAHDEQMKVLDREVTVGVWTTTITHPDGQAISGRTYLSRDGVTVRSDIDAGVGAFTLRLVSEAEARRPVQGEQPDLFGKTVIEPDQPIRRAGRTTRAVFRLRPRDGALPELPNAGSQRVQVGDDGTVMLTVDTSVNSKAEPDETSDPQFREPSVMIGSDDERVMALARRAARDREGTAARANAMRSFVYRYVSNKNLATAFASASETARTKSGDCSEHAVLLAAMLRADGIPSRVASGLVYADRFAGKRDIFGWHMWTQALIDGEWVDLDATLPVRYHAAHILTSTSSLADGAAGADLSSVLQLMGNLDIDVIEFSHGR